MPSHEGASNSDQDDDDRFDDNDSAFEKPSVLVSANTNASDGGDKALPDAAAAGNESASSIASLRASDHARKQHDVSEGNSPANDGSGQQRKPLARAIVSPRARVNGGEALSAANDIEDSEEPAVYHLPPTFGRYKSWAVHKGSPPLMQEFVRPLDSYSQQTPALSAQQLQHVSTLYAKQGGDISNVFSFCRRDVQELLVKHLREEVKL